MRAIISGNVGAYQYLPLIEKTKGKGQYSRDISVSASACKQMIDNYSVALKSLAEMKKDTPAVEVEGGANEGIFPADNVETNEVNEVSPGIADVTKEDSTKVEEVKDDQPVPVAVASEQVSEAPSILQGVPSDADVAPVALSSVTEAPQEESNVSIVTNQEAVSESVNVETQETVPVVNSEPVQESATEEVAPVQEPVVSEAPVVETVTPVVEEQTPVVQEEAVVPSEPVQEEPVVPVVSTPVVEESVPVIQVDSTAKTADVVSDQVNIDADTIDAITNSLLSKIKDVQQVEPQVEKVNVESNINFNANASFAPDATLDQVVVGAQELFMSGVQSLVLTITEKVYRDLYKKEKELNEREELLNQRERMLNEQISMMVQNYNNNQPVQNVPVDTINTSEQSQ
jgi:hypothetical protein